VKFRAKDDDEHAGTLEHAYMQMAGAAGIDVPPTTMLGRTRKHRGYFAIRRFDRDGVRKLHMHTLAGLLHAPHIYPSTTYRELLLATRRLTRDEAAVSEMFRRACFNVFAHNRDDHTRNFAFLMNERGEWRPSPAYDLTFSPGPGGEHSMLVGREGANPTEKDLLELAKSVDLKRPRPVLDEVRLAVGRFARHADEAGLPSKVSDQIAKALGVETGKRRARKRRQ
jgi:serine/threonine-protein kinase HipA